MHLFPLLFACGRPPDGPGTVVLQPDATRDGLEGADGPLGVAWLPLRSQARVTEAVDSTVYFPSDVQGWPEQGGAWPTVLLEPGGLVEPERYGWLAMHLASRGAAVLVPEHPLDLAIMEPDNGLWALDRLMSLEEGTLAGLAGAPAAVGGHSLGGVVSAMEWVDDERLAGLFLLASWPAEGTPVEDRAGGELLSLMGGAESEQNVQGARDGYARFAEPRHLGIVDGLNHYGWTDDATADELARDGVATRPVAEARTDALRVLDTWTDAVLRADAEARERLDTGGFPGLEDWQ